MVTTDILEQLIKDYQGHYKVFVNRVKRADGSYLRILDDDHILISGVEVEPDDSIIYQSFTKQGDYFVWSIPCSELIAFQRERTLNKLGI